VIVDPRDADSYCASDILITAAAAAAAAAAVAAAAGGIAGESTRDEHVRCARRWIAL